MVLTKIEFPMTKNGIVKKDKFVLNSLFPIGFKETNIKGCFLFLFGAYQDYQDRYMYLQIMFQTEDPLEHDIIKNHPNYIPNYDKDPAQKSAYLQMISKMADDNLYATDFIMTKMINNNNYYEAEAMKRLSYSQAEEVKLFIPMNTYLRIKIFLENLNVKSRPFPCEIFTNPRFNNPNFVTIEQIKRDETSYAANKEVFVDTHYKFYSGPYIYKANYRTFIKKDGKLSNELNQDLYTSQYSMDYYIEYITRDEDDILVVFNPTEHGSKLKYEKEVDTPDLFISVLRLSPELIEKTNFYNQFNKIYIEE